MIVKFIYKDEPLATVNLDYMVHETDNIKIFDKEYILWNVERNINITNETKDEIICTLITPEEYEEFNQ